MRGACGVGGCCCCCVVEDVDCEAAVLGGGVGVAETNGDGDTLDGVDLMVVEAALSLLYSESSPVCRCNHAFFR